jgi:GNAT superfamily N-acetyltransferase
MTPKSVDFILRKACKGDIPGITRLSAQLGYPETSVLIARRLRTIQRDRRDHRVFVAVAETRPKENFRTTGTPIGWIHVFLDKLLIVGPRAEIGGLVVDEHWRSRGVGEALLKTAEKWARTRDLDHVVVRTNVLRRRAHHFYEKYGYELLKQSKVYSKEIS